MKRKCLKIIALVVTFTMVLSMTATASAVENQMRGSIRDVSIASGEVTIFDALEVLKFLVNMDNEAGKKTYPPDYADMVALWERYKNGDLCPNHKADCEETLNEINRVNANIEKWMADIEALAKAIDDEEARELFVAKLDELHMAQNMIAQLQAGAIPCAMQHCTDSCLRPAVCTQKHCTPACANTDVKDWLGDSSGPLPVDPPGLTDASRPVLTRVTTVNLSKRDNIDLSIVRPQQVDGSGNVTLEQVNGSTSGKSRARFEDKDGKSTDSSSSGIAANLRIRRGGTFVIGGSWVGGQIYIDARDSKEDAHRPPTHNAEAAAKKQCICLTCRGERPLTCIHGSTVVIDANNRPTGLSKCNPTANPDCFMEIDNIYSSIGTIIVPKRERFTEPVKIIFRNQVGASDATNITSRDLGPAILDRRSESVTLVIDDKSTVMLNDTAGIVYKPIERLDDDGQPNDIEPNGTVYIRSPLTITGRGNITITGNYSHGISCRDDITINGGRISIITSKGAMVNLPQRDEFGDIKRDANGNILYEAEKTDTSKEGSGILGRDSVTINAGEFKIDAGKHGIRSNNIIAERCATVDSQRFKEATDSGFICINGGRFIYIHAPFGSAMRPEVPEITVQGSGKILPGAGGGLKIDNSKAIFEYTIERQEKEVEVDPD